MVHSIFVPTFDGCTKFEQNVLHEGYRLNVCIYNITTHANCASALLGPWQKQLKNEDNVDKNKEKRKDRNVLYTSRK